MGKKRPEQDIVSTVADIVSAYMTRWGGTTLTGRDISADLANLDLALTALRDGLRGASTKDFTTLEVDIESILTKIDVALSTRASQATLASVLTQLDVTLSTIAAQATLVKIIPIAKAATFNTALPAAEASWLGADITPTNSPSYLRVYVCVAAAGVFRVARTVAAATVVENLNVGATLVANAAYMFTIPWRTGDSINFRYSVTGANILRLLVDEIGGAE